MTSKRRSASLFRERQVADNASHGRVVLIENRGLYAGGNVIWRVEDRDGLQWETAEKDLTLVETPSPQSFQWWLFLLDSLRKTQETPEEDAGIAIAKVAWEQASFAGVFCASHFCSKDCLGPDHCVRAALNRPH